MSERLKRLLIDRIRASGPLTWAEFMEVALYDPRDGFFSRHPVGERAHFVTSPHVSPVFARLLAHQIREGWDALGRPEPLRVIELGAGDGTLAIQLRQALDISVAYVGVERSAGARASLASHGINAVASLEDAVEGPGPCVILANELLDNLPFHRLRAREGGLVEVFVDVEADRLVEVEGPATLDAPSRATGEWTVSPSAARLVRDVARALAPGYALIIDYGFTADEDPELVRGYADQRLATDLLADPGATDITGPVDFEALTRVATEAGLQCWGPVLQREVLHNLGYRAELDAMRRAQAGRESAGAWRDAIGTWAARGDASLLVDPAGLGSFKVLALGTAGLPEPRATRPAGSP